MQPYPVQMQEKLLLRMLGALGTDS